MFFELDYNSSQEVKLITQVRKLEEEKILWGSVFDGVKSNITSFNDCQDYKYYMNPSTKRVQSPKTKCVTSRKYISSQYELLHLNFSLHLASIPINHFVERIDEIIRFIASNEEFDRVHNMLHRIRFRMENNIDMDSIDDLFLLSRYEVTTTCNGASSTTTEYIEPLTIYGRNPYGFMKCMKGLKRAKNHLIPIYPQLKLTESQNVDYILLHHHVNQPDGKKYLFDAGSSRFDSGIWWIICSYFKVHIFVM